MSVPGKYFIAVILALARGSLIAFAQDGARIIERNDVPTLEIDGKPQSGMARCGYNDAQFPIFRPAGVTLYFPTETASQGFWLPATWTGPDSWDYSRMDATIDGLLAKIPDAYLIVKFSESAPDWWREKHPGELVQTSVDGQTASPLLLPKSEGPMLKAHPGTEQRTVPSWASPLWRQDISNALAHAVRHLESGPHGKRIIGYLICSGEGNEWFGWGNVPDWSPANINGFRAWLGRHYSTVEALRQAWHENAVTFENALPPGEEAVNTAGFGSLRDPRSEMRVIDYLAYNSAMTASAVDALAASIKHSASKPVVVGAYFGYLAASDPRWGHQDVGTLLDSSNIDFLCSPSAYWEHRRLGVAAPESMGALGSVRMHGKYWFNENDHITSISVPDGGWGVKPESDSIATDVILQRRELAWAIVSGVGQWWQDVRKIQFNQPDILSVISECTAAADAALNVSHKPIDEAAAIVDPESVYYIKPDDYLLKELRRLQISDLTRSGMAMSVYSSDDLSRLRDKRLLLFCDMIAPSAKTLAQIQSLKSDGRVLVFLWAAGSMSRGGFDVSAMQKLTGIKVRCLKSGAGLHVTTTDSAGEELRGIGYGTKDLVSPAFVPDDDNSIEVWGKLDSGEPALAIKKYPSWTAVYSSAPMIAPEILAKLGTLAHIHHYASAGDALWITKGMMAVTAFSPGPKAFHFPDSVKLFDRFGKTDLGEASDFRVSMKANETKLFRIEH